MTDQSATRNKRTKIIEAAREVFSEKDFHDATVSEVAERAKVGKGTVYLYFSSKEELFVEVIRDGIARLVNEVEESIKDISDPSEKIYKLVETVLKFVQRNESFFRAFTREEVQLRSLPSGEPEKLFKLLQQHLELVTQVIDEGVRLQHFKNIDARLAALALQGIIMRFSIMHVEGRLTMDLLDTKDLIVSLFLQGIQANRRFT